MSDQPEDQLISTDEVLDLIAEATGRRLARRTIHSYVARGQMPEPKQRRVGLGAWWDPAEIEAWIQARRPRGVGRPAAAKAQAIANHQARLTTAAQGSNAELERAVATARDDGLSWAQIAAALPSPTGGHLSRQAAQSRFKDSGRATAP